VNRLPCPCGGALLLCAFPGRDPFGGGGLEQTAAGLAAFRDAGATMLLTLVESRTLARLGVPDFGEMAEAAGLAWLHLPIQDFGVPDAAFLGAWRAKRPEVHARLDRGETIGVHCRAGLGRTGTVAAMILVERGLSPEAAIAAVQRARPGTVETQAQQAFVRSLDGG
jgi:hypothetical protein